MRGISIFCITDCVSLPYIVQKNESPLLLYNNDYVNLMEKNGVQLNIYVIVGQRLVPLLITQISCPLLKIG